MHGHKARARQGIKPQLQADNVWSGIKRDYTWRRRWLALAGCLIVKKTKTVNKWDIIFAYLYYKILYEKYLN